METPPASPPPEATTSEAFNQVYQIHKRLVKMGFYGCQLRDEFHILVKATGERQHTRGALRSHHGNLVGTRVQHQR